MLRPSVQNLIQLQVVEDEDEEERPKQRQRLANPDSEDEDEEGLGEDEAQQDAAESPEGQLVKKLVRYAMACDFSRTPIRRDGIKEKGVPDSTKA